MNNSLKNMPDVSIIMPTKNGIEYIDEVMSAIFSQKTSFKFEVIVIDSGSKDGTLEILAKYPIRLIKIPPATFNHGLTRNMGAEMSTGNILVFLNQDVTCVDQNSLEKLVSSMNISEDIVAAYGRQIARIKHNPIRKKELLDDFPTASRLQSLGNTDYETLTNREKRKLCTFNTIWCAIKKDYFLKEPFKKMEFGEDAEWVQRAIQNGHSIYYNSEAAVIHSHDFYRSLSATLRIFYDDSKCMSNIFGKIRNINVINSPAAILFLWLRDINNLSGDKLPITEKIYWSCRSLPVRTCHILATLLGYNHRIIPDHLEQYLSSVAKKKRE
jgi:rhamnosyltransferase